MIRRSPPRAFRVLLLPILASLASAQTLISRVTADDAFEADHFGEAVALAGDTLFVGAPLDNVVGRNSGSVYVLRRRGLNWFLDQKLTPDVPERGKAVGVGLAADGETLVAIASRANYADNHDPALYVFEKRGGAWVQAAVLRPIPPGAAPEALFATSVAVAGDWILAGCPRDFQTATDAGAVHAYRRTPGGWERAGKITPSDPDPGQEFGGWISLAGNTMAVSAGGDGTLGMDAGACYVFELQGASWVQVAKLTAADGRSGDRFGAGAIAGNTLVVGAPSSLTIAPFAGAAYVFERQGPDWIQTAKLAPADLERFENFGTEIVASQGKAVIRSNQGSAPVRVFEPVNGVWQETVRLQSGDTVRSLALAGDFLALGAPFHDQRAPNAGGVLMHSMSGALRASLSSPRQISWGKQRLEIERGPEHAGHVYFMLGSMTGTSRGIPFRGFRIPLNPDPYFVATTSTPGRCLFPYSGVLDASGRASLVLEVPPAAYSRVVGLTLDHAFLESDLNGLEHVSNAVQVRFGPRH